MSDHQALYQAVLDAPDDDAPRLIYADWLDEHGQPERAAFIRLQCTLARLPANTDHSRALQATATRLERDHRAAWLADLLPLVYAAHLRRGLADAVRLTIDQFLAHADDILARHPVRVWEFGAITLFIRGAEFTQLVSAPALGRVRGLAIGSFAADELLRTLTGSAYLGGLRSLQVSGRGAQARSVRDFFQAAARIDDLHVESGHFADFKDLWRAGSPARLRRLSLVRCQLPDQSAEPLVQSAALGHLECLHLDGNVCPGITAAFLAGSDPLSGLRELSLAGIPIGDIGAIQLARSATLRNLRVLNLSGCDIDSAGAQALADSPYLSALEYLCLDDNRVSVEVEQELKNRFGPGVCSFSWGAA